MRIPLIALAALFLMIANSYAHEDGLVIKAVGLGEVSQTLAILGDGSGAIGEICVMGNWPADGATNCDCVFTFSYPNGKIVKFNTPTVDHGRDFLRCSYAGVDPYAKWFDVSVVYKPSNISSNSIRVYVP